MVHFNSASSNGVEGSCNSVSNSKHPLHALEEPTVPYLVLVEVLVVVVVVVVVVVDEKVSEGIGMTKSLASLLGLLACSEFGFILSSGRSVVAGLELVMVVLDVEVSGSG